MVGSCTNHAQERRGEKPEIGFANHFPRKTCRVIQLGRLPEQQQSNMQTQKSREFPGCRIIHTFSQRITPPQFLAARRG